MSTYYEVKAGASLSGAVISVHDTLAEARLRLAYERENWFNKRQKFAIVKCTETRTVIQVKP